MLPVVAVVSKIPPRPYAILFPHQAYVIADVAGKVKLLYKYCAPVIVLLELSTVVPNKLVHT